MKNILLIKLLFTGTISFATLSGQCQPDKLAYAVTDSAIENSGRWNFLRSIDLKTGTFSNILIRLLSNSDMVPALNTTPYNGVAAIAYDKKNKRLYYTPMLIDRLSYVDLKTMRTHVIKNNFTELMPKAADQSNIFTRMAITNDYGYALTNDSRHLIRFSTKNNSGITDLGSLIDAPGNNEISVHNTCSSFGGDIIADDEDRLYLFTSANHVFKINTKTKVAKYQGTISGLPAGFTTSGAVVNHQNKVVVVSAIDATDIYTVNINTLIASKSNVNNAWRAADLGNGNILKTGNNRSETELIVNNYVTNDSIQLFPNPVTSGEFKIQFAGIRPAKYIVDVIDARGQLVVRKIMDAGGKDYFGTVSLPGLISKGLFVVRITDQNNKVLFNDKIVVQ